MSLMSVSLTRQVISHAPKQQFSSTRPSSGAYIVLRYRWHIGHWSATDLCDRYDVRGHIMVLPPWCYIAHSNFPCGQKISEPLASIYSCPADYGRFVCILLVWQKVSAWSLRPHLWITSPGLLLSKIPQPNVLTTVSSSISSSRGDGPDGGQNIITCWFVLPLMCLKEVCQLRYWTCDWNSLHFLCIISRRASDLQVFTYTDITFPSWWGTEVMSNTADTLGTPYKTVEPGYLLPRATLTVGKLLDRQFGRNGVLESGVWHWAFPSRSFLNDAISLPILFSIELSNAGSFRIVQ